MFHYHLDNGNKIPSVAVLTWRIPGTGEPSMGSHRVGHDWSNLAAAAAAVFYRLLRGSDEHFSFNVYKSVWQVAKPYTSKHLVSRWHSGKESTCQCRRCKRQGSVPGSRRSLGGGNSSLHQYSYLGNPMARGTWWTTVHGSRKSRTWLSTHTSIVTMMMTMMMFKTKLSSSQQKMLLLTFLSW